MKFSFPTVVTLISVLASASAESTFMRGGSTNSNKDANNNPRSLALSMCVDSDVTVFRGKKCDWITEDEQNMAMKCNRSASLGMVYDLCPVTCAKVDLGPCTTSKLVAMIESLEESIAQKDATIADFQAGGGSRDRDGEFLQTGIGLLGPRTSSDSCAANYNSNEPCCDQEGRAIEPENQCPESKPTCVDYVYNDHWGICE